MIWTSPLCSRQTIIIPMMEPILWRPAVWAQLLVSLIARFALRLVLLIHYPHARVFLRSSILLTQHLLVSRSMPIALNSSQSFCVVPWLWYKGHCKKQQCLRDDWIQLSEELQLPGRQWGWQMYRDVCVKACWYMHGPIEYILLAKPIKLSVVRKKFLGLSILDTYIHSFVYNKQGGISEMAS